jgi:hypothetical protein
MTVAGLPPESRVLSDRADIRLTGEEGSTFRAALDTATRILQELGVTLNPQKTRIVHVRHGFEFLGYKIKQGRQLELPSSKLRSGARSGALYAYPREKSILRFMDQVRQRTKRRVPLKTEQLIAELNPLLRGWGEYFQTRSCPNTLQPT